MRQAQRKKEKDKIAVALMLAFCVIALTSIFTIKSNIEKINSSGGELPVSDSTSTKDVTGEAEKQTPPPDVTAGETVPVCGGTV